MFAARERCSPLAKLGATLAKTLVCPTLLRKVVEPTGEFESRPRRRQNLELAEGARFELASPARGCRFSRPVHSTALPPLRVLRIAGAG